MNTRSMYEKEIIKEVHGLPQPIQGKIAKIIHFFKKEIMITTTDEKIATKEFLSICGTWEDERTVEEQLSDIYSQRASTTRAGNIF
jgi:hypothetical protein